MSCEYVNPNAMHIGIDVIMHPLWPCGGAPLPSMMLRNTCHNVVDVAHTRCLDYEGLGLGSNTYKGPRGNGAKTQVSACIEAVLGVLGVEHGHSNIE